MGLELESGAGFPEDFSGGTCSHLYRQTPDSPDWKLGFSSESLGYETILRTSVYQESSGYI